MLNDLAAAISNWKIDNPGEVWDGIIWKSGRIDASSKARIAAKQLCLYLMGVYEEDSYPQLLSLLRQVRNDPNYQLPSKSADPKK